MALPVNFKDDVLASSMDGKRRYNMITNSDGTVSFEDVTTYSQEGSNFGSAQINNTNGAINTINNNVLDTIEEISANTSGGKFAGALALKNVNNSLVANSKHFYFDYKNGKYGYNTNPNRGADTFVPFKDGGISEFTFNSTSSFSAEIGAKYDIICATAYDQNAKSKLQGATIINEYCEYNLSNVGYLYCAEIEATQNVVNFAGVSHIGLGYLKK